VISLRGLVLCNGSLVLVRHGHPLRRSSMLRERTEPSREPVVPFRKHQAAMQAVWQSRRRASMDPAAPLPGRRAAEVAMWMRHDRRAAANSSGCKDRTAWYASKIIAASDRYLAGGINPDEGTLLRGNEASNDRN